MKRELRVCVAMVGLLTALSAAHPAFAQKQGGILKIYNPDSPASMSIHEEAAIVEHGTAQPNPRDPR